MGNYQYGTPGVSLDEAIWSHIGLKPGGGLIGESEDNPPFRPLVCSHYNCEHRYDPEEDATFYVVRHPREDYRYGHLTCAFHIQDAIEIMTRGLFGAERVEVREAKPEDWQLNTDRIESGFVS